MATVTLLDAQCQYCQVKGPTLSTCSGCEAVLYCSKDHQTADWSAHKSICSDVKKWTTRMEREETRLRNHPGDWTMPANPFDQPGPLWGWLDTRDYMRARYALVDALREIKTREAISAAYAHVMEMLRLNRSDDIEAGFQAPALMLRLGKDQEAYDFMKWYGTVGSDEHYDFSDMSLPFLNLGGEDAFEPPSAGNWTGEYSDIGHQVALTLLKLRLLLDLYSLQESMKSVADHLPQEILDYIRQHLVSDIVAGKSNIMRDVRDGISIQPYIKNIEAQMNTMFDAIHQRNKHFWPAMINPGSHLSASPDFVSAGSIEEMQFELRFTYDAWQETPGAIDWVSKKLGRQ